MNESSEAGVGSQGKPEMTPARLEARLQASLALLWHGGGDMETALIAWVGDGSKDSPAGKFRTYMETHSIKAEALDEAFLRKMLRDIGLETAIH